MNRSHHLPMVLVLPLSLLGGLVGHAEIINIAPLYGVASADDYYSDATPQRAIDGVIRIEDSHWNAGSQGEASDPHWLIVDLRFLYTVSHVVVVGRPLFPESEYEGYTNIYNLYAGVDGDDWTLIGSGTWAESTDPAIYSNTHVPGPSSVFRYVKYEVVGGTDWAALQEMEVFIVPDEPLGPGPPFEPVSVLQRTWEVHGLISGDSPTATPGWYWLTMQLDYYGNAMALSPVHDSRGNSGYVPDLGQFSITRWGTLVNSEVPSYLGAVSGSADLITGVATMSPGQADGVSGYNLQLAVEKGSTYTVQDLAGTWWMHHLNSGDSPGWTGWSRAKLQINLIGNFSFVPGSYLNSDGLSGLPEGGTASITGDGTVQFSVLANSHGILNAGKDFIVVTADEQAGYNLSVLQKRSGEVFTTSDLAGTWHVHGLISGDAPEALGWAYGKMQIDAFGNVAAWASDYRGKVSTLATTASLTADGLFALGNNASTHGTMSDDKNTIVYTATSSAATGGNVLTVLTRQTGILGPVYRFWSPLHGHHFYTLSRTERDHVVATYPAGVWTYEGPVFSANAEALQPDGTDAVYRFWSPLHGSHFYTISEAERDTVIATYPESVWTYEGPVFYAYSDGSQPAGTSAVYRFWSNTLGGHFYTLSEAERDYILATWPHVWEYEGIAWYAYE